MVLYGLSPLTLSSTEVSCWSAPRLDEHVADVEVGEQLALVYGEAAARGGERGDGLVSACFAAGGGVNSGSASDGLAPRSSR